MVKAAAKLSPRGGVIKCVIDHVTGARLDRLNKCNMSLSIHIHVKHL